MLLAIGTAHLISQPAAPHLRGPAPERAWRRVGHLRGFGDGEDAGQELLGIGAALAGIALVPLLAVGVAATLGMGTGSVDNDGIGVPLSRDEVQAMMMSTRSAGGDAGRGVDGPFTFEEAAEEQALVDVLSGGIKRAR